MYMLLQRFGCALVDHGQINLKSREFSGDLRPIDESCDCTTCRTYTRAYLNTIVTKEPVACHLLSVHNIAYQVCMVLESVFVDLTFFFIGPKVLIG